MDSNITDDFNVPVYFTCYKIFNVQDIDTNTDDMKLSVIHINIRSLRNREYFEDLTTFLEMFNFNLK